MPVRLEPVPVRELHDLAAVRVPGAVAARLVHEALPPAFVARRLVQHMLDGRSALWCAMFYVIDAPTDRIVGTCTFKNEPVAGVVEIGYGIASACRGRGIATVAIALLLKIAIRNDRSVKVLAQVNPENIASTRVLEKLGFTAGGTRVNEEGERLVQWLAP